MSGATVSMPEHRAQNHGSSPGLDENLYHLK